MDVSNLLLASLQLMLLGMGVVFTFLGILVGMVKLISLFSERVAPHQDEPSVPRQTPPPVAAAPASPVSDPNLVEVITTAVQRYRQQH